MRAPAPDSDAPDVHPSDHELLRRHVDGDHAAFGELTRRHRNRLWAVALRTLGNPEDAADALQDALVSAFRGASGFRGDSAVTTWLHRVVVNACLDHVRRQQVRRTGPLPDPEAGPPDPTDRVADAERVLDVEAALGTLPAEQRAALVLVDVQGYPVEEAARILGVPPGTVKSRCSRGRARLVPLLAHLRPGGAGRNPGRTSRVPSGEGGEPKP